MNSINANFYKCRIREIPVDYIVFQVGNKRKKIQSLKGKGMREVTRKQNKETVITLPE